MTDNKLGLLCSCGMRTLDEHISECEKTGTPHVFKLALTHQQLADSRARQAGIKARSKEQNMTTIIRSTVEFSNESHTMYCPTPDDWDQMTQEQRNEYCDDVAITHQNDIAPCGADVIEADSEDMRRIMASGEWCG